MIGKEKLISIVTAVQEGQQDAATELYNTFHEDLYYFILKTVKDSELAADLTQDTFIEILQTIGSLREPAAFVTWSRRIAYHRCTGYFRKKRELLADENEDGYSVFDELIEEREEFIPDEALDKDELKRAIQEMIDDLPEEQRAALLLRYFDEVSVKEIAEIQNVSEGTVKSRLNYARKALKTSVEEYEKKNGIKLHCKGVVPLLLWFLHEYQNTQAASAVVKTVSVSSLASKGKHFYRKLLAILTGTAIFAAVLPNVLRDVSENTVTLGTILSGNHAGYEENAFERRIDEVKEDLKFIHEWDGFESEWATFDILTVLTGPGAYACSQDLNDEDLLYYTGISDRSLIIDAAAKDPDREPRFYAALVRVKNPEDIDTVLAQMKANFDPTKMTWYSKREERRIACWNDMTVDDFKFYVSEEYILMSYTDPYFDNIDENHPYEDRRSSEKMQQKLDVVLYIREKWGDDF